LSVPRYMVFTPAARRGNKTHAVDWGRSTAASGRSVMNFDTESIDGYAIPVDPMDLLQCDSCQ
jgi:hypothetical protein